MEQRNAMNEDLIRMKRERMGLKGNAGLISRARYDGMAAEGSDPRIRSRFAHILNGGMRDRMRDFDNHELSVIPGPVTSSGRPVEHRRDRSEESAMSKKQRMYQQRRQQQQPSKPAPSLPDELKSSFSPAGLSHEDAAILSQAAALFGDTPSRKQLPDISGRLLPDRSDDLSIDLNSYAGRIPFDPINQIKSRAARRSSQGVDYRELEASRYQNEADMDSDEDRYLSQTYSNEVQAPAYDERAMQAMARSMAEAMVKTVMQEHLDKNKGRKFFKEVKTNGNPFKDSPNSKLVEIDGKYYKMDLKPVKIKTNKK